MNLNEKLLVGINKIILEKIQSTYKLFEVYADNRKINFLNEENRVKTSNKQ